MAMGSTTYEWILDHEFADKDPAEWKWPYDIPVGSSRTGSCRLWPAHRSSSSARRSQPCTNRWPTQPVTGTSGSSVGETWPVSFADVGLLDEVVVSIAPVTLGGGAPLLPRRIELRLDELGRNGDFVSARFSVVRAAALPYGLRGSAYGLGT
jgi:hypothetical protein